MPDVEVKFDFSYKLLLPNTAVRFSSTASTRMW